MEQAQPVEPVNCFLIFCRERRNEFRVRFPSLNNSDITSKLGEEWRSMSAANKAPFKKKASTLRKVKFISNFLSR